ncbi:MAG: PIG-L family deacetylase [Anaerolineaceae bacterium]|nr:MAG: PIG-L family deacetylase [Anaerolineaceae bacterium]
MSQIFLSPHMDDTTLSCGAGIAQLQAAGVAVRVVNVMAGHPPDPLPDSPLVRELHQRWGAGAQPITIRRAEEARANALLGAEVIFMDIPDAIYRTAGGAALYTAGDAHLFGAVHPDDPAGEILKATAPPDAERVYVPAGVGGHVDHCLTRDWALRHLPASKLIFYEDYPYAAHQHAVSIPSHDVAPRLRYVGEREFEIKCAAIACYASQISTFWRDIAHMRRDLRDYMTVVGGGQLAERYWVVSGTTDD